jgi:hypothetical protein
MNSWIFFFVKTRTLIPLPWYQAGAIGKAVGVIVIIKKTMIVSIIVGAGMM